MDSYRIKGLEKLINNSVIKKIYPMVDHIDIRQDFSDVKFGGYEGFSRLDIDIFLNDPDITKENMYDKELDPHYLVEHHIKQYLPYFGIENVVMDFIVWGPDGEIIDSYSH